MFFDLLRGMPHSSELSKGAYSMIDNDVVSVLVVSFRFLLEIMVLTHQQMAHIGRNKLVQQMQNMVWHPSITKVASDICAACPHCQKFKVPFHPLGPPVLCVVADSPFSLVAVDLLQLPACEGYIGCFVMVDHHSKWLVAVPIRNKRAALVTSHFEERVLAVLPCKPESILTDNGSEFISGEFKHVLQKYDIH